MERDFEKIRQGKCTLYIDRRYRSASFEQSLLRGEEELDKNFPLKPVASSKYARVYNFETVLNNQRKVFYYKHHFPRSFRDRLRYLLGSTRSQRAFKAGLMLAENGFEVPAVVAIGYYRKGFFHTTDFVVTLEAENAMPVNRHIPETIENISTEKLSDYRTMVRDLGTMTGKMHAKGIFHGDLRHGNILAGKKNEKWRFFLLDNERTRKFSRLPRRLRLKNLVQVNMCFSKAVTKSDRMRFFKCYLEENPGIGRRRKKWAHKIIKKTYYRLKKKQYI